MFPGFIEGLKERFSIKTIASAALACVGVALLVACSASKNTAGSRWWQSFNSRYNAYYNGKVAYIEGALAKETGNKDNFTEMIPLYTVGNKASRELGKPNFETAITKSEKIIKLHSIKAKPEWNHSRKKTEKDIEWLSRREYNPFMWKAWLMMGKAQFQSGKFEEAAATFSYMSRLYATQPAIYGKARAWLARCYVENDWVYDAEDVIGKMRRDSIHWSAQREWDFTMADYLVHTKRYEEAIPWLRKVIKHELRHKQKAREWFLLGQIYASLGQRDDAYKAYRHVVSMNPPYELEFNARIAMTEVMADGGRGRQMIGKLRRMASSDKNAEYLDQVYYAMGNIYLSQRDTLGAIGAYENGVEKGTRSGIEKGVLLLTLGNLYWDCERFSDSKRCYGQAIGLLDKDRPDYNELSERSKVLESLVPHTDAVHLQDSLQALAKMSEKDRNEAIDRVIDALKKKEKEERQKAAEAEAAANGQTQAGAGAPAGRQPAVAQPQQNGQALWYFYNPTAVSQGKETFRRQWGNRENVDDWQRVNKTVVAMDQSVAEDSLTEEQRDSVNLAQKMAEEAADSVKQAMKNPENDPHKREYYLAQIPFSEEKLAESNKILMDGLYNAGVIFKDRMDNLDLSEKYLRRLADDYPSYEGMENAYYHLYLLYNRRQMAIQGEGYLDRLKADYPESQWTKLLSDPYYRENAMYGEHMEDSLYAATYEAFRKDRASEVLQNTQISETRFPEGAHRDRFVFIGGLSKLNAGDAEACLKDMQTVVEKFPQSSVSPLAGMIINGVKAGRTLHGGKFDMGDVWSRRAMVLSGDSDSVAVRAFVPDREVEFRFMLAYVPDSVNENQLLYQLARYNFTNFIVRNFDLEIEEIDGLHRMAVRGFRSYDEALQYARHLFASEQMVALTRDCRRIIISEQNLRMLGTTFSYDEYDDFYEKNFTPLEIADRDLLSEPADMPQAEPEPVVPAEQEETAEPGDTEETPVVEENTEINPDEMEIPAEPEDPETIDIPAEPEAPAAPSAPSAPQKTEVPVAPATPPAPQKTEVPAVPAAPQAPPQEEEGIEDDVIEFEGF